MNKAATKEEKEYQISIQIVLLNQTIDRLSSGITQLEQRIDPILLTATPTAESKTDVEILVP